MTLVYALQWTSVACYYPRTTAVQPINGARNQIITQAQARTVSAHGRRGWGCLGRAQRSTTSEAITNCWSECSERNKKYRVSRPKINFVLSYSTWYSTE